MIIVAHWDIPVVMTGHQQKKLFIRWSHTAKAFGINELRFVEVDPMPEFGDAEINLKTYATLAEALKGLPKKRHVYVEQGGKPIHEFQFPDDPVFIFGGDYGGLKESSVSIDTKIPLHADIACGIVLNQWHSP